MKKSFALFVSACLALGLVAATGTSAEAKSKPNVTIGKISNKTAKFQKSVLVRVPSAKPVGKTSVTKVVMTVKKGSKTYANRKLSVNLKAGKYKVTTYAYYKTYVWRSRYDKTLVHPAWSLVNDSVCKIDAVTGTSAPYGFDATCSGSDFDGTFPMNGTATIIASDGAPERTWSLSVGSSVVATEDPQSLVGKTYGGAFMTPADLFKVATVKTNYKSFSKLKVLSKKQKLTIKQGKKPGSAPPVSTNSCPSWAPIKGNINESRGTKIYHLPGGRWYKVTNPEICFSSVRAAKKAGYRASQNG